MTISIGDKVPEGEFAYMGADGPTSITSKELFAGKKVVLFAVPGAFTPTCSNTHLPGFILKADEIKAKGVDTIACVAVNDVFVMGAWSEQQKAEPVMMLADGSANYVKALGLTLDLTDRGLGLRADRFAMIVDDGVVTHLAREAAGQMDVSSAESIIAKL